MGFALCASLFTVVLLLNSANCDGKKHEDHEKEEQEEADEEVTEEVNEDEEDESDESESETDEETEGEDGTEIEAQAGKKEGNDDEGLDPDSVIIGGSIVAGVCSVCGLAAYGYHKHTENQNCKNGTCAGGQSCNGGQPSVGGQSCNGGQPCISRQSCNGQPCVGGQSGGGCVGGNCGQSYIKGCSGPSCGEGGTERTPIFQAMSNYGGGSAPMSPASPKQLYPSSHTIP